MRQIGAAADMHVKPAHRQPCPFGAAEHFGNLLVPDAVLRAFAAGIRLLAVAVAEAGIHSERDVGSRHPLGQLLDHVGRAAIDVDAEPGDGIEALAIEDVGRVDNRMYRRQAVGRGGAVGMGCVAGRKGPLNLTGAHRIDHHPFLPHEVEYGQIRAGFLGEPHRVPGRQIPAAAADHLRVIDIERRAERLGEVLDARPGNRLPQGNVVGWVVGCHATSYRTGSGIGKPSGSGTAPPPPRPPAC
jgi:hypothetical protein